MVTTERHSVESESLNEKSRKIGKVWSIYYVMMMYWMWFGTWFKISAYSPTHNSLTWDIGDAHHACEVQRLSNNSRTYRQEL